MMMRLGKLFIAMAIACGAMATSASAALSAFWQNNPISAAAISNDPLLASMQSWSLMVTHTDGDWASAGLRATLPAGRTFYQHSLGGNTKPNPAFVSLFAGLAYDTYVTSPLDTGTSGAPAIIGGHPASPTSDFGGTTGVFSVSWGDTSTNQPGTYEIARLTFPQDVLPTIFREGNPPSLPNTSNTSQVNPDATVFIPDIPEPASLGLVAAAGLLALRRRNG
jgi:hypothetical protein